MKWHSLLWASGLIFLAALALALAVGLVIARALAGIG